MVASSAATPAAASAASAATMTTIRRRGVMGSSVQVPHRAVAAHAVDPRVRPRGGVDGLHDVLVTVAARAFGHAPVARPDLDRLVEAVARERDRVPEAVHGLRRVLA